MILHESGIFDFILQTITSLHIIIRYKMSEMMKTIVQNVISRLKKHEKLKNNSQKVVKCSKIISIFNFTLQKISQTGKIFTKQAK